MPLASKYLDKLLDALLQRGSWPTTFLFVGQGGSGKLAAARRVAARILGTEELWRIELGGHPDCLELRTEGVLGMHTAASIRQLIELESLAPYLGSSRIAIIIDAERMSSATAHFLLKTLEETSQTGYLLLTSSLEGVLPAIRSRAMVITFPLLSTEELMAKVPKLEKRTALLADGSYRGAALATEANAEKALQGMEKGLAEVFTGKMVPSTLEMLDNCLQQTEGIEREQLLTLLINALLRFVQGAICDLYTSQTAPQVKLELEDWKEIVSFVQKARLAFERSMRGVWQALFLQIAQVIDKRLSLSEEVGFEPTMR